MRKRTIVVVEDEPAIASAVASRLEQVGFRVEIAGDGPDGVDLVEQVDPDLVILDLMLPGFDGLEVCKRIQEHKHVPVVMLTALDTEKDVLVGLEQGVMRPTALVLNLFVATIVIVRFHRAGALPWRHLLPLGAPDAAPAGGPVARRQVLPLALRLEVARPAALSAVAEEAGVHLALHPDDPPVPQLAGVARIMRNFENFKRAMSDARVLETSDATLGGEPWNDMRFFNPRKADRPGAAETAESWERASLMLAPADQALVAGLLP